MTLVSGIKQSGLSSPLGIFGLSEGFQMVGSCCPLTVNNVSDTFRQGWYSGFISDTRRLDEDPPTILECITFWIASAMNYEGGYVKRRVGCIHHACTTL